jgi:hypothetical protein
MPEKDNKSLEKPLTTIRIPPRLHLQMKIIAAHHSIKVQDIGAVIC